MTPNFLSADLCYYMISLVGREDIKGLQPRSTSREDHWCYW